MAQTHLDQQSQQELARLCHLLQEDDTIKRYQKIARQVKQNAQLAQLQTDLKQAQKAIVNDDYYQKPKAANKARQTADQLQQKLDQHPLTQTYRQALADANDTLEIVTTELQQQVDALIEKGRTDGATKDQSNTNDGPI